MKSLYQVTHGNLEKSLLTVANRYIAENPIELVKYRTSNVSNFKRNKNFRYEIDFDQKFPNTELEDISYTWGRLPIGTRKDLSFYINPYGPTKLYINGQLIYKSDISAENIAEEAETFEYHTEDTELSLLLVCRKTKIGWGCEFGSTQIKSNPMHVLGPTQKRSEEEGWIYTTPIKEEVVFDAELDREELENEFLPTINWDSKALAKPLVKRLGLMSGTYIYAAFKVTVVFPGKYLFKSNDEKAKFLVNDAIVENGKTCYLGVGEKIVILELADSDNVQPDLFVEVFDEDGELVIPYSAFEEELPQFAFLGPLKKRHSYYQLADLSKVTENQYWRLDSPGKQIRIFLETDLFGKWNYPLGVTLRGLLEFGIKFENKEILNYVKAHIELCTRHYFYALWDTEHFGAPNINNNIALPDSLDDCGSFSRTTIETSKYMEIADVSPVLAAMATYIMENQGRQADGTLYRVHAHMPLMEDTLWADDAYMCVPFLAEYTERVKDAKYFEEAKRQLLHFYHYLWIEDKQLFSHVYNFRWRQNTGIPWGRGNGWYLFSITDILLHMDKEDIDREKFIEIYNEFIEGLHRVVGPNNMWHQLLDDHESYEETSCTLSIIYSLLIGVNNGWVINSSLRDNLIKTALKSWNYLLQTKLDSHGNLFGVCRGSGYSFNRNYYKFDLLPKKNDTHGIGIVLMAGCKISDYQKEHKNIG